MKKTAWNAWVSARAPRANRRSKVVAPLLSFHLMLMGISKVPEQSAVTECSVNGEIKLRAAITRRSSADDLANIASFDMMESWSQPLFGQICQEPPTGYRHISIHQIIHDDHKLWTKVAETARSKVVGTTAKGARMLRLI